jgi:hypothetical protein
MTHNTASKLFPGGPDADSHYKRCPPEGGRYRVGSI